MDNTEITTNWEKICTLIKSYNNQNEAQINAFFSRLHPQVMSEGFILLTADNDFIKKWIESHYLTTIQKALEELFSVPFEVLIEVVEITTPQTSLFQEQETVTPLTSSSKAYTIYKDLSHPSLIDNDTEFQTILKERENSQVKEISDTKNFNLTSPSQIVSKNISKEIPQTQKSHSLPPLTFENFVIGDSNRMAYHMAVSVAESPGKPSLNPLFIYGKSGLGKTHLLRAIQNYLIETRSHCNAIYLDSTELLSEYVEATTGNDKEKNSYRNFKTKYENADILLIDDVQYFQGKKQTLDIVFQIFNKLTDQGKQVVLSADRAPKNIDIDERYKTRFNSGGTFDIQPPEVETKLGIIKTFIKEYQETELCDPFIIPENTQMYIAEISSSNIRELKSAVTKIIYQSTFTQNKIIELEEVKKLLENHFSGGPSKRLSISDIQKAVEDYYKISHQDLVSAKRNKNFAYPRKIAIYLSRQMIDLPLNSIGKHFGGRDHTTIMYSINTIERQLKSNREMQEEIEIIEKMIKEG